MLMRHDPELFREQLEGRKQRFISGEVSETVFRAFLYGMGFRADEINEEVRECLAAKDNLALRSARR